MNVPVPIKETIQNYYGKVTGEYDNERSWEYCYRYFHGLTREAIAGDRDHAALQLGFYLASWGMYRGSSFPPRYAYTIHRGVIDQLVTPQLSVLWEREFGASNTDSELVPILLKAIDAVRDAYKPFAGANGASDTLVTKIILGTLGCLPACDRYFIKGFKSEGLSFSHLNAKNAENFVHQVLDFCQNHLRELREEQDRIERASEMRYPLMRLVDMYFWQIGSQLEASKDGAAP